MSFARRRTAGCNHPLPARTTKGRACEDPRELLSTPVKVTPMGDRREWPTWTSVGRHPGIAAAVVGGSIVLAAALIHFSTATILPRIDHTDQQQVDLGRRLYADACASCHGASLEGQQNWQRRLPSGRMPAPPHDAAGHTWHHADSVLFAITKRGPAAYPESHQTDMPAFDQRLSDSEIAAILAYIKNTWPPDIRARQARLNDRR